MQSFDRRPAMWGFFKPYLLLLCCQSWGEAFDQWHTEVCLARQALAVLPLNFGPTISGEHSLR